jgi:hypothetical protein
VQREREFVNDNRNVIFSQDRDEEKKECKGTSKYENLKRKGETPDEEKQDSKKTKAGPEGEI